MRPLFDYACLLTAIAVFLSACGAAVPSGNVARSQRERLSAPELPPGELDTLVAGNNRFAMDLYQALRAQDGNLFYSPFSISLALGMTYAGARGETEAQMARVLHYDLPQTTLHPAFNALDLQLEAQAETPDDSSEPLQLEIANAIWAEASYPFLQEYLDTIAENYGAGIYLADFINRAEAVRSQINKWVSTQTNGKIKDLIPAGALNTLTRMVLVNAIYFKGDWARQFEKDSTYDQSFHALDGSEIKVPMMHQGLTVPYVSGEGYQAVELSYQGGTAAMDILLPDEGNFEAFEASLDATRLDEIFAGMQSAGVELAMPKFSFTDEFNLTDTLQGMGMAEAFEPDTADFTGMSAQGGLFISDVIHKAFVAVDEKGTEAAAATAVVMRATSAQPYDVQFTVDRPFIFLIRDLSSGQILFVGRVMVPER